MPISKNKLQKEKRIRLNDMVKEAGLDCSFPEFGTKLLQNWENKKPNDPTNVLLKKLVRSFK